MNRDFPIDRIISIEEKNRIVVNKFLPHNELIFTEHFPESQIYPGSMVLNTIFAACHLLIQASMPDMEASPFSIDTLNLKEPCKPGEIIEVIINWQKHEENIIWFRFKVNGFFCTTVFCVGKARYRIKGISI